MKIAFLAGLAAILVGCPLASQEPTEKREPATRPAKGKEQGFLKASELIGRELVNARGERLGKIEEIVVDGQNGRLAYAVATREPKTGGETDRLWVVPWDMLRELPTKGANGAGGQNGAVDGADRADGEAEVARGVRPRYRFDLDDERIIGAPGFSRHDWPVFDRAYGQAVYDYYDATPYWDRPGMARDLGLELLDRAEANPPREPNLTDPFQTRRDVPPIELGDVQELKPFPIGMFDPRNIRVVEGTVTSVIEQQGPENDFGVGIRLLVRPDGHPVEATEDMLAYVGPTKFVRDVQGFRFQTNDRVLLKGAVMMRTGRLVFVPLEIETAGRTLLLRKESGLPVWRREVKVTGR